MTPYFLIHLSDLHIGDHNLCRPFDREENCVFNLDIFAEIARDFKILSETGFRRGKETIFPTAIVLTGDIADSGHPDDLRAAKQLIDDNFPAAIPIVTAPGNYERLVSPNSRVRYSGEFEQFFAWTKPVHSKVLRRGPDGLSIISVDFTPEDGIDIGNGSVEPRVLDQLVQVTGEVREEMNPGTPSGCVVWALHFAPRYPGTPEPLRLRHEQRLIDAARQQHVDIMLCGHLHKRGFGHTQGVNIYYAGTGTCPTRMYECSYHFVIFDVDSGSTHNITSYDFVCDKSVNLNVPVFMRRQPNVLWR